MITSGEEKDLAHCCLMLPLASGKFCLLLRKAPHHSDRQRSKMPQWTLDLLAARQVKVSGATTNLHSLEWGQRSEITTEEAGPLPLSPACEIITSFAYTLCLK